MMDGIDSIRRTIYDNFGNVMKTLKPDVDSSSDLNPQIDQEFRDEPDFSEDPNIGETSASDALWDLSELDPEIYEDVFEPTLADGTPPLLQNTLVSSEIGGEADGDLVGQTARVEPTAFEKPKNFQTVSLDDVDIDEDENSEEANESTEENGDSPLASVSNIGDVGSEKSDMEDLFAKKIEVRPQVRQLLDKYGTIPIDQLTKEIKEVAELLGRK